MSGWLWIVLVSVQDARSIVREVRGYKADDNFFQRDEVDRKKEIHDSVAVHSNSSTRSTSAGEESRPRMSEDMSEDVDRAELAIHDAPQPGIGMTETGENIFDTGMQGVNKRNGLSMIDYTQLSHGLSSDDLPGFWVEQYMGFKDRYWEVFKVPSTEKEDTTRSVNASQCSCQKETKFIAFPLSGCKSSATPTGPREIKCGTSAEVILRECGQPHLTLSVNSRVLQGGARALLDVANYDTLVMHSGVAESDSERKRITWVEQGKDDPRTFHWKTRASSHVDPLTVLTKFLRRGNSSHCAQLRKDIDRIQMSFKTTLIFMIPPIVNGWGL
jgi:hypothetical protein